MFSGIGDIPENFKGMWYHSYLVIQKSIDEDFDAVYFVQEVYSLGYAYLGPILSGTNSQKVAGFDTGSGSAWFHQKKKIKKDENNNNKTTNKQTNKPHVSQCRIKLNKQTKQE